MASTDGIFLTLLVAASPRLLFAIVGLVMIHARLRQSHPRAYLHGMLGMGLLLVAVLWGALSQGYILAARIDGVAYPPALASKTTMANLVGSVFYYASLVFILLAILADRRRAGANTTQMDERTDGQAR